MMNQMILNVIIIIIIIIRTISVRQDPTIKKMLGTDAFRPPQRESSAALKHSVTE